MTDDLQARVDATLDHLADVAVDAAGRSRCPACRNLDPAAGQGRDPVYFPSGFEYNGCRQPRPYRPWVNLGTLRCVHGTYLVRAKTSAAERDTFLGRPVVYPGNEGWPA